MTTLSVAGLTFAYDDTPVLQDLAMTLESGLVYGVVGGSGAGKTTLIKCLLLLLRPSRGEITFFEERPIHFAFGKQNQDTAQDETLRGLRRRLSYVPQASVLFPFLSLKENVCLPLVESLGLDKRESERRARAALERLDILRLQDSSPWQLSGGQNQRGAIARSLACEPQILLLDEPTSSLDAVNVGLIGRELVTEARQRNATVLIVTHNLGFAQMFCDRLFVLKAGRLDAPRDTADVDWAQLVRDLL